MIPICDDLMLAVGDGLAIFRSSENAVTPPELITNLSRWEDVKAGVTVLVSTADVTSERLRNHLRQHVDQGVDVLIKVFDPEGMTAVTDHRILDAALDFFGVAVSHPVQRDTRNVVPQELKQTPTRLTPTSVENQRAALSELTKQTDTPSLAKLQQWLRTPSAETAAQTRLAAVPQARFGTTFSPAVNSLPASAGLIAGELGGSFQPIDPAALQAELDAGRLSAALVRGWNRETGAPTAMWLVAEPNGAQWVPPSGSELANFNVDGAQDPYSAMAERYGSAMLLGSSGKPYTRLEPLPERPPADRRRGVNTFAEGAAALIGEWRGRDGARKSEMLAAAEGYGKPVILVDVRRGLNTNGQSKLTPELRAELHETLRRFTDNAVVVATESNQELAEIVRRYRGIAIQPDPVGLSNQSTWRLYNTLREHRYSTLTKEALDTAESLFEPRAAAESSLVRGLVGSHTWQAAEEYYRDNPELKEPDAVDTVRRLLDQSVLRDQTTNAVTIEPHPNHTLPALATLLEVVARTKADPSTVTVTEPQRISVTEKTEPHGGPVNVDFLFGYLTDRELKSELHDGGRPAGRYATGLLWLREIIQAAVSPQANLSPAEALTIIAAKGEFDGERALRTPRMPERLRAHAGIAAAAFDILSPETSTTAADRERLLKMIDCLTGEDRVAWLHIVRDVLKPGRSDQQQNELTELLNTIATCH